MHHRWMSVSILYIRKWNEVHEKYPTRSITTLFGDEVQLINQTTEKDIKEIKSNIWVPESPDDYANLQPTMVLSNGPLADKWNTLRTFSSTMKNNSNIGRNLYYTVVFSCATDDWKMAHYF